MTGKVYTTQIYTARDKAAVRISSAGAGLTNKQKNYISTVYIESTPIHQKKEEPHDKDLPPSE